MKLALAGGGPGMNQTQSLPSVCIWVIGVCQALGREARPRGKVSLLLGSWNPGYMAG